MDSWVTEPPWQPERQSSLEDKSRRKENEFYKGKKLVGSGKIKKEGRTAREEMTVKGCTVKGENICWGLKYTQERDVTLAGIKSDSTKAD